MLQFVLHVELGFVGSLILEPDSIQSLLKSDEDGDSTFPRQTGGDQARLHHSRSRLSRLCDGRDLKGGGGGGRRRRMRRRSGRRKKSRREEEREEEDEKREDEDIVLEQNRIRTK